MKDTNAVIAKENKDLKADNELKKCIIAERDKLFEFGAASSWTPRTRPALFGSWQFMIKAFYSSRLLTFWDWNFYSDRLQFFSHFGDWRTMPLCIDSEKMST